MKSPPQPAHGPSPRTLVLGLSLAQLVSWGSALYAFAVFVEPVEAALVASRAQMSLGFSLALLAEGLAAFAVGRWIDAGHERAVMAGGSLLVGAGLIAHGFVQSLAGFYVAWALIGLGMAGTLYAPVFAVVTRRYPADFRRAIITITFLGGLASTVFIPLTAGLIARWDWRVASWVLGGLNLALCLPLHLALLRGALPAAETPTTAASAAPLAALLRGPVFWRLGVFTVLMMAVTAAVPPHLVSLLRESRLPPAWAIALPASIGVLQVLGRLLLYFGDRRLSVHATNRWVPTLLPLAFLALLLAGLQGSAAAPLSLLFALLFGVGNGMLTIVKGTAMAQYISATHVGALNGALGLPLALARAAAPLLVGLLWSPQQGYTQSLLLLLALTVLGLSALWSAQTRALAQPQ